MDPSVRDALLQDPEVQQALQRVGGDVLGDPEVQQRILDTCKQKFPQYAATARDEVAMWARDPEVQRRACEFANAALAYASQGGAKFVSLIEQGPTGVRLLAFIAGVASCANAGLTVANPLIMATGAVTPVTYVISGYQVLFAGSAMLFEAQPEWFESASSLTAYQEMLIDNAKFLCKVGGRGLFYIFQGSLWLAFASLMRPVNLSCGLYLVFIGVLHVLMHYGVMPQTLVQKARELRK
eukprot:gnl/TRDRNA2_/TRDRNA2_32985_c0_seq1.p1 gnl/TRDRNA2_/TRDRNA2_32985_c0~~gnl/TRDRNA2_/TRDRNA2_32985_c0_seq1.p1  ORF type:complete len:239 (+),score=30.05 gnl/TRDRNA2_/TRDRNA2_32985_c0_seq1:107-823(+)